MIINGRKVPYTKIDAVREDQVLHLKFNELVAGSTIIDHSGLGNDGTEVGTLQQGLVGYFGRSVYMSGGINYVTVADDPSLQITGDLTIACWVWVEITSGDRCTLGKWLDPGGSTIYPAPYVLYFTRGYARFGRGNGTVRLLLNSDDQISSGRWYHVAVTMSGTATRFFINGVFDVERIISVTTADGGSAVGVGAGPAGNRGSTGMMDDVRIYNRALTDAEIATLASIKRSNSGYVGHWDLAEASGTTVDDSVFGNNGTIVGATQSYTGFYKNYLALEFDNTNDYVVVPHNQSSLTLTRNLSATAFVKVTNFADDNCICAKASTETGNPASPFIFKVTNTGALNFEVGDGSSSESVTSTDTLIAGQWHYVSVSKDGNDVSFFIDDDANSGNPHTLGGTVSLVDSGTDLYIGSVNNNVDHFNGLIQDVQLFNRSLTLQDNAFFHDQVDSLGEYGQLHIWYKLDETTGTTLEDFSKNHNDITFTQGVTLGQTGHINGSALFGGDAGAPDASVSVSNLPIIGIGVFTCSAWVKSSYTTDKQCIFSLNSSDDLAFYIDGSTDAVIIEIGAD